MEGYRDIRYSPPAVHTDASSTGKADTREDASRIPLAFFVYISSYITATTHRELEKWTIPGPEDSAIVTIVHQSVYPSKFIVSIFGELSDLAQGARVTNITIWVDEFLIAGKIGKETSQPSLGSPFPSPALPSPLLDPRLSTLTFSVSIRWVS